MKVPRPLAAALGVAVDAVIGEPRVEPHPVALLGDALRVLEHRGYHDDRLAGVRHAAAGVAIGATAGRLMRSTAVATYVAVAGRALGDAALDVRRALDAGDLDAARQLVPALVGRDPAAMDEKELCRAAVESVAENTVDAVVAPALWGALAGAPGATAYRAVNTMDSMIGHRSPRYRNFGWAAARLDDGAGWVPARITAGLVAAVRPAAAGQVWRAVRRDAPAHPSPNAGVAEAAFAAALGLRLGGTNRYGDVLDVRPPLGAGRPAERDDIDSAVRLSRDATLALAAVLSTVGIAGAVRRRRR